MSLVQETARNDFRSIPLTLLHAQKGEFMRTLVLSQEVGIGRLKQFMQKKIAYSSVAPFVVTPSEKKMVELHVAKIHQGDGRITDCSLNITDPMSDALDNGNGLLVIPNENELYQWID